MTQVAPDRLLRDMQVQFSRGQPWHRSCAGSPGTGEHTACGKLIPSSCWRRERQLDLEVCTDGCYSEHEVQEAIDEARRKDAERFAAAEAYVAMKPKRITPSMETIKIERDKAEADAEFAKIERNRVRRERERAEREDPDETDE